MKRAALILSAAMVFAQAGAAVVQRHSVVVPSPTQEMYKAHLDTLYEILVSPEAVSSQYRVRPLSRAEIAVGTHNPLHLFIGPDETKIVYAPTDERLKDQALRRKIAENFWRLELLIRTFYPEMIGFGVKDQDLWDNLALLKKRFTDLGIVLRDPYTERFTDVPEGHWADEAIHNLRRSGILFGCPGGRFGF